MSDALTARARSRLTTMRTPSRPPSLSVPSFIVYSLFGRLLTSGGRQERT